MSKNPQNFAEYRDFCCVFFVRRQLNPPPKGWNKAPSPTSGLPPKWDVAERLFDRWVHWLLGTCTLNSPHNCLLTGEGRGFFAPRAVPNALERSQILIVCEATLLQFCPSLDALCGWFIALFVVMSHCCVAPPPCWFLSHCDLSVPPGACHEKNQESLHPRAPKLVKFYTGKGGAQLKGHA